MPGAHREQANVVRLKRKPGLQKQVVCALSGTEFGLHRRQDCESNSSENVFWRTACTYAAIVVNCDESTGRTTGRKRCVRPNDYENETKEMEDHVGDGDTIVREAV